MVQGLLGGLRVYLNALFGADLAAIHGSFSQIVFALAVAVVVLTARPKAVPHDDIWTPERGVARRATLAAVAIYVQVVCGAVLRHTASRLGPRLHLLAAFLAVVTVFFAVQAVRDSGARATVRRLGRAMIVLTVGQVMLGVEAWVTRFADGFAAAQFRQVTVADAALRSAHVLVGYALFGVSVALAITVRRARGVAMVRRSRAASVLEGAA
jgi:hypothetical protein